MNLKKEKEMFEEWYEKHHNGRQISCDYVYEDNSYSIGYANAMWISWQASANRQGYKLVPVDKLKKIAFYLDDMREVPYREVEDLISEIKAMIGEESK